MTRAALAGTSLYLSDTYHSMIRAYEEPRTRCLGVIRRGVNQPQGIAVDARGDLFVADYNTRAVTEYAAGIGMPVRRYREGLTSPTDVAVGSDGTVYVVNGGVLGYDSSVVEYARGSLTPTLRFKIDQGLIRAVAVDRTNALYVSYITNGGAEGQVNRYPRGSAVGTNLGLYELGAHAWGLAVDEHGDVLVADSESFQTYVRVYAAGATMPTATIAVSSDSNQVSDIRSMRDGHLAVAMGGYLEIVCVRCTEKPHALPIPANGVAVFPDSS